MKLLKKTEIAVIKSNERKKEIEEGARLAKTIDVLRQTKGKEEENLRKFREQSLNIVNTQIEEKSKQIRSLDKEIEKRKEERLKLEAPLDLVTEWKIVRELKSDLVEKEKRNNKDYLERDTRLIERESEVESKTNELRERDEKLKEQELFNKRLISETSKNYDISQNVRTQSEKLKNDVEKDIREKYIKLSQREQQFDYKERDLLLEKSQIENDKKLIEKEKIHIASQQQSLKRAWENIKKLTNK